MQKNDIFDVLVVYSSIYARSAHSRAHFPFDPQGEFANRNTTYEYFLQEAASRNITISFCCSDDVIAAGTCSSYWSFVNGSWKKSRRQCAATVIFDKCSPINKKQAQQRKLLFSDPAVVSFTDNRLVNLFFDKLTTYKKLPYISIPTVQLNSKNEEDISSSIQSLEKIKKNLARTEDFGHDFILKDRFGLGGKDIYKISEQTACSEISQIIQAHPEVSFVLQPFIHFDSGFTLSGQKRATDIRIIYMGTDRIQSYARTAKKGDFRCNMHQGGTITYTTWNQLPSKLLTLADKIAHELKAPQTLYAVDFIIGNSGNVYLLEGNTSPGIDWYPGQTEDAVYAKQLISAILTELQNRSSKNKKSPTAQQYTATSTRNFTL